MEENGIQPGYDLSTICNYTDPIVRHDPTIEKSLVGKIDASNTNSTWENSVIDMDIKKVEAIDIPVINLNNKVLDYSEISYLRIDYDSFVPSLQLTVNQKDMDHSNNDSPGLDNVITVVMTSRVDGAYKSVSLDFYVLDVISNLDSATYIATYKLLSLEQNHTEAIKFCMGSGCQCEWCKLPEDPNPTTYEYLHELAIKAGLGFATTDQVKEIADHKLRFLVNQTYKEAMEQHIKFGGLDENSIFDGWIDLYRYLVVVNVPWVLSQDLDIKDIGAYVEWNAPNATTAISDQQDLEMSYRFLTNNREAAKNINILISDIEKPVWITSNEVLFNQGVNHQYFTGAPLGYAENNTGSCHQHDIEVIENSYDGDETRENYSINKIQFLGYEMGNAAAGNTPILMQQQIRNNYFRKLRQRRLKICLDITNMSLQRGTLVYLHMFEYSEIGKRELAGEDMDDPVIRNNISNGPIPDPFLTGFYYIDGMEFIYSKSETKIIQYLYLIKKDPYINRAKGEFEYLRNQIEEGEEIDGD
ncbi:MAG: hypothetical protein J1F35_03480 [Erysipelotrichales bacterium]|nr:hypothetical protein [Erysipelotrichales bacterium]